MLQAADALMAAHGGRVLAGSEERDEVPRPRRAGDILLRSDELLYG
jgi:hypothetical protein